MFQDRFGEFVKIYWPTSPEDFANTDANDDGILTFEEVGDYMYTLGQDRASPLTSFSNTNYMD